jgi:hypothetical protein
MKLFVKHMIGPRCIIKEDGQKIYDEIHGPLKEGETVTLDFGGFSFFQLRYRSVAEGH